MVHPDSRLSTPRACCSAPAGRLGVQLEVASARDAAHQQANPAPGDESVIQDRCRAVVLVRADQAPEPLRDANRGFRDNAQLPGYASQPRELLPGIGRAAAPGGELQKYLAASNGRPSGSGQGDRISENPLSTLSRHPRPRIRRPEAAGQTKATHPKVVL